MGLNIYITACQRQLAAAIKRAKFFLSFFFQLFDFTGECRLLLCACHRKAFEWQMAFDAIDVQSLYTQIWYGENYISIIIIRKHQNQIRLIEFIKC